MNFEEFLLESEDLNFRIQRAEERLSKLIQWNKNGDRDEAIKTLRARIQELKQQR